MGEAAELVAAVGTTETVSGTVHGTTEATPRAEAVRIGTTETVSGTVHGTTEATPRVEAVRIGTTETLSGTVHGTTEILNGVDAVRKAFFKLGLISPGIFMLQWHVKILLVQSRNKNECNAVCTMILIR